MTLEALGGFTVAACASGQEALERAVDFAPDLIILDVMMPGLDGPATLRELCKLPALAAVPVIFMTALSETVDKVKGFSVGAVDYITKTPCAS